MPPRNMHQGRSALARGAFLWVVASSVSPLMAQELELQRDYPTAGPFVCPAHVEPVQPGREEREEARQLLSAARQQQVLGDLESARELLSQATDLDGTWVELAYQHAHALQDLELRNEAILEYCRALSLGAEEAGIDDSRTLLDDLYEIVRVRISERGREAFVAGLVQADSSLFTAAAESFSVAIDESPYWAAAYYNRGIVYEQMGRIQESLTAYRAYLELSPSDVDPTVILVSERIGMLEGAAARPTASPRSALTLGVLFPGMGQYYSGRRRGGTVILALTAAAVATGVMVKTITVRCLDPLIPDQDCPPEQIVDESTERPYLGPALGAAAAVTLAGAIEAFFSARARRRDAAQDLESVEARGIQLSGPSVTSRGSRVDLNFVRIRFR